MSRFSRPNRRWAKKHDVENPAKTAIWTATERHLEVVEALLIRWSWVRVPAPSFEKRDLPARLHAGESHQCRNSPSLSSEAAETGSCRSAISKSSSPRVPRPRTQRLPHFPATTRSCARNRRRVPPELRQVNCRLRAPNNEELVWQASRTLNASENHASCCKERSS